MVITVLVQRKLVCMIIGSNVNGDSIGGYDVIVTYVSLFLPFPTRTFRGLSHSCSSTSEAHNMVITFFAELKKNPVFFSV